jgi:hypothetical protein
MARENTKLMIKNYSTRGIGSKEKNTVKAMKNLATKFIKEIFNSAQKQEHADIKWNLELTKAKLKMAK